MFLPLWSVGSLLAFWQVLAAGHSLNLEQRFKRPTSYQFHPSTSGLVAEELIDPLPLPFDFETSNSPIANATNSWWISSYVTGSNEHQYLLLSHLFTTGSSSIYRGSIYDITEPEFWQYTTTSTDPTLLDNSQNGEFNVTTSDFFFGSILPGNATKRLRTASTRSDVKYDVTFDLSAPILFNTGIGGLFQFGDDHTGEWAMPAGITTGSLVHNGQDVTFDPSRSYTWYDRQWNVGPPTSLGWTWFQLHLHTRGQDPDSLKLSLWRWDSEGLGTRQWVTSQAQAGVNSVQPVKSFKPLGQEWTSPHTNLSYAQKWHLVLQDRTELVITSAHPDQELHSPAFTNYEGFVTVSGTAPGGEQLEGYGLVEIQPTF
ncbi:hydroxyneurosporene synthase [Aspergillus terreus]|uniref:Hydroxyneurosporene synthase n=1 Tax=Aspergillus terreus TaxID=33178 RepID=A0A5M3YTA5_ASPTE|nr:hypothetical protein ATETN484_0002027700 [Aspergillus terreus]GFF15133.1 hydroxyneurosporene synthase [Aspergillus terreus]